jgi:4-hydroxybenzoate polyprenyltransferase
MTGFSFVGVLFVPSLEISFVFLLVANFIPCYVFSVYALNSFIGYYADMGSERLRNVSTITRNGHFLMFIISTLFFGILSYWVSIEVLVICLLSLLGWTLYYVPPIVLKSSFLGGTGIHLVCGVLHFHMGYASFAPISTESMLISVVFALFLCIGHINHEILDREPDQNAGIFTTTVRIGEQKAVKLRTFLTLGLTIYLIYIWHGSVISSVEFTALLLSSITMLIVSGLRKANANTFQRVSRTVVSISCCTILIWRIAQVL